MVIRMDGEKSSTFRIELDLRQERILQHQLLTIYGEYIMRQASEEWNGGNRLEGKKSRTFRKAGRDEMAQLIQCIKTVSESLGLN